MLENERFVGFSSTSKGQGSNIACFSADKVVQGIGGPRIMLNTDVLKGRPIADGHGPKTANSHLEKTERNDIDLYIPPLISGSASTLGAAEKTQDPSVHLGCSTTKTYASSEENQAIWRNSLRDARFLLRAKRYQHAAVAASLAVAASNGHDLESLCIEAEAMSALGRPDDAVRLYTLALAVEPGSRGTREARLKVMQRIAKADSDLLERSSPGP